MGMSGKLQESLAPVTPPNSMEFNQLKVAKKDKAQDMGEAPPELDFRTMLQNSNAETTRERSAKKAGDLSGAKTDEDFYRMLNERNNPSRVPKNTLGKDDFLKLFIAQMQNQDPLNPSDSTQMASQMAQFNSLEQMMNVNTTLDQLVKSQDMGRTVQMINYVGKDVDVSTGILKFDKNKLTKATFEIDQPLPGAMLEVRDGSGQVIANQDLGSLMPGEHNVKWDGKLKDGHSALPGVYNFQVVGKTVDGQDANIPIKSKVKVTGIDLKDEGAFFTEIGKIQLKDVASVGLQGFDEAKVPVVNEISNKGKQGADQPPKRANESALEVAPGEQVPQGLPPGLMEAAQKMVNAPTAAPAQEPEKPSDSNQPPDMIENSSGIPVHVVGAEK